MAMTEQEKQRLLDEEHLKLLRFGYIIAGVADALFALFPLIYVLIGVFIAAGTLGPSKPGEPNPAVFGLIIVIIGLVVSFLFAAQAGLKLFTARALRHRRNRTLCFLTAGLSCLQMPWGTLLGVFTFMVLGRGSVKELFEPAAAQLAPPPQRMASSLFDDEAIHQ
ncbi:MAG TPA: hypothetical protein VFD58_24670 [Blastocatellia bacterium]|nr:hypothetical protein [Blastocatellia bacterium]